MGAKAWMLVYTNLEGPLLLSRYGNLDRFLSEQLAKLAFPQHKLESREDLTLCDVCPSNEEILVGCFEGVSFLSASEFGLDQPSTLDARLVNLMKSKRTFLFVMHSVVDFFAFAVWENGQLRRSFSASSDNGIIEDIGERFEFELSYWNGEHQIEEMEFDSEPASDYPLVFHPLDFGENVLSTLLGFCFEGPMPADGLDPFDFGLLNYKRKML